LEFNGGILPPALTIVNAVFADCASMSPDRACRAGQTETSLKKTLKPVQSPSEKRKAVGTFLICCHRPTPGNIRARRNKVTPRNELVHELELACPPGDSTDFCAIAAALERGDSEAAILYMPEVFRWPETYMWLKAKL
jgi:hypothetical protein